MDIFFQKLQAVADPVAFAAVFPEVVIIQIGRASCRERV